MMEGACIFAPANKRGKDSLIIYKLHTTRSCIFATANRRGKDSLIIYNLHTARACIFAPANRRGKDALIIYNLGCPFFASDKKMRNEAKKMQNKTLSWRD
jgi:hypothetical protein